MTSVTSAEAMLPPSSSVQMSSALADMFPGLDLHSDLALETNKRPIASIVPRSEDTAVHRGSPPLTTPAAAHSDAANASDDNSSRGGGDVGADDGGSSGAGLVECAQWSVPLLSPSELLQQMHDLASLSLFPAEKLPGGSGSPSASPVGRAARMRDLRVFCNFLSQPGKKCSFNVRLSDKAIRGIDVVEASIKVFLLSDEKLPGKYSENPLHYKLYLADEQTGEELGSVKLESSCAAFQCLTVEPLPAAKLYLYPQRTGLLPMVFEDVYLIVEIRAGDKVSRNQRTVPADLLVEKLEKVLTGLLTNTDIIKGSLRIRYGPSELNIQEKFDFGAGCGQQDVPISERTVLSLARFGVTEVILQASKSCAEGDELSQERSNGSSSISGAASSAMGTSSMLLSGGIRRLDEEEANTYQQFDVIKINKFGIRQDRVIGVDGERVYNMRPSTEAGKTKNPERYIGDIELVRDFRDRPNYCEIEYSKLSKYDTDRIELKTPYDCAMLVEKLRVLKKIHDRKAERRNSTTITRFLGKLGFGGK